MSVFVVSSDQSLGLQDSETYTLRVNAPTTIIHATNVFGALRAMESLFQLATEIRLSDDDDNDDDDGDNNDLAHVHPEVAEALAFNRHHRHHRGKWRHGSRLVIINETSVWDSPRFRHRGLLIDTARHYLPTSIIKTHLDAMEASKMNVLHWHLTDDESFPLATSQTPELARCGAFSTAATYTSDDVDEVVEYARARGIRVIPEIDTPGHVASWARAHPEIVTRCGGGSEAPRLGPLNPAENGTYTVLWQLLREVASLFPDAFMHVGGDEVEVGCWLQDPGVVAWMEEQEFGRDVGKVLEYHMQRVIGLAEAAGKEAIVWQDVMDEEGWGVGEGLPKSTIVQVWKWSKDLVGGGDKGAGKSSRRKSRRALHMASKTSSSLYASSTQGDSSYWLSELAHVTKTHRAILSAPWYINLAPSGDASVWKSYYTVEPLDFKAGIDQKDMVIGGEACVWGEQVDETNSVSKTWPLAAAVAERLWSEEQVRDVEEAEDRLRAFRCRLLARGVEAAPLWPDYCRGGNGSDSGVDA